MFWIWQSGGSISIVGPPSEVCNPFRRLTEIVLEPMGKMGGIVKPEPVCNLAHGAGGTTCLQQGGVTGVQPAKDDVVRDAAQILKNPL